MVKVGDTVKWENTRTKEKLSGKIIGGEKGKNWKIEKGGKKYLVPKDRVKKGVVKMSEKKKVAKGTHTMPDGTVMTGKTHTKDSKPVAKKSVDKDSFLDVLSVMGEVAKSKGKSTKKEVDSKVALDKKAQKGKLTQKAFLEDITLAKDYDYKNDEFYEDMFGMILDDIGANANTEAKQQRAFERASSRAYTEISKYRRRLFNRAIKGKKFKSFKDAENAFLEDYNSTAHYWED